MFQSITEEIKNICLSLQINPAIVNPDEFQAVFVKKLSNQNVIKENRRIAIGDNVSHVNQTHIDVTGLFGKQFFFEELINETTIPQSIDVDIIQNNLIYLETIKEAHSEEINGYLVPVRSSSAIPQLSESSIVLSSNVYKKQGHSGEQVQINIPNLGESFTLLHSYAYQGDALVMFRYDFYHYLAFILPIDICSTLFNITNTTDTRNINIAYNNANYNQAIAEELQQEQVSHDLENETNDLDVLQESLLNSNIAGVDIERTIKSRVSQGSFRRLLMIKYHHKCGLCNINTTAVLRASHIKEWSISEREERINANNGILLCANHDALFDKHLISFEPITGNICISSSISEEQRSELNLAQDFTLDISDDMRPFIELHYRKFNEIEHNL